MVEQGRVQRQGPAARTLVSPGPGLDPGLGLDPGPGPDPDQSPGPTHILGRIQERVALGFLAQAEESPDQRAPETTGRGQLGPGLEWDLQGGTCQGLDDTVGGREETMEAAGTVEEWSVASAVDTMEKDSWCEIDCEGDCKKRIKRESASRRNNKRILPPHQNST